MKEGRYVCRKTGRMEGCKEGRKGRRKKPCKLVRPGRPDLTLAWIWTSREARELLGPHQSHELR